MNSRSQSDKGGAIPRNDHFAEWRLLLKNCGRKPTRKNVHALRVVTLRLQAEVEQDLAGQVRESDHGKAILRFSKQAEKLRRVLGPVREFDVWLEALRGLRASLSQTAVYVPRSTSESIRGIERLEGRLKRKRRTAEKKLVAEIEKHGSHLVSASEAVDAALEQNTFGERSGITEELAARFRAVSADFPKLDEEDLHEFRKRIKTVRYLAEMHAGADPMCAQIGAQMKKMQAAIGEWHDWQALAREVREGRHAKDEALAELLDTVTAESFDAAMSTVDGITTQMLSEPGVKTDLLQPPGRKPPMLSEDGLFRHLAQKLA